MELGLRGKVVLVAGASGAIGGAIAKAMAAEGCLVAAGWSQNKDAAQAVVEACGGGMAVRVDQRDRDAAAEAVGEVERTRGPVAVLVTNAVSWPAMTSMTAETWDTWADSLTANT